MCIDAEVLRVDTESYEEGGFIEYSQEYIIERVSYANIQNAE